MRLTQELFGHADPTFQENGEGDPIALMQEYFEYFEELVAARRKAPRDDLATVIAQGQLDGAPIPAYEAMSYFVLIVTAGHDTTSSSIAGGLLAVSPEYDFRDTFCAHFCSPSVRRSFVARRRAACTQRHHLVAHAAEHLMPVLAVLTAPVDPLDSTRSAARSSRQRRR